MCIAACNLLRLNSISQVVEIPYEFIPKSSWTCKYAQKWEVSDSRHQTPLKWHFISRSDYKQALNLGSSISICSPSSSASSPGKKADAWNAVGTVNISVGLEPILRARQNVHARLLLQHWLLWCRSWTPPLGGAPCSIFAECIISVRLSCLFLPRCSSTVGTLRGPGKPICGTGDRSAAFGAPN